MATQNTQPKFKEISFSGFDGINFNKNHSGEPATAEMTNWRILDDGSIQKRFGFGNIASMGGNADAIWAGRVDGENVICYFANKKIRRFSLESKTTVDLGTCPASAQGNPKFFFYRGDLYFSVDGGIFILKKNSMEEVIGYVPLMGENWRDDHIGPIKEPFNIFNRKARFTYTVSALKSIFYKVIYPILTIDSVKVNGEELPRDRYLIDDEFNAVDITKLSEGDKVEVAVTFKLPASEKINDFIAANDSAVFGGINTERLFMWKRDAVSNIFCSAYVDKANLDACKKVYPDSSSLYFPENYDFPVGENRYRIRGVVRHFDRLLIFTEGDVWMADSSACGIQEFPVMNINSTAGCCSSGGLATAGNDPVSIGNGKIYRWTSDTDELNECNAYVISAPIEKMLDDAFFKNAKIVVNKSQNEIWFATPIIAWVYNLSNNCWYRYLIPNHEHIFEFNNSVALTNNGSIYLYGKDYYTDGVSNNGSINAVFESGGLDFGNLGNKRLSSVSVVGDRFGSTKIILTEEQAPVLLSVSVPQVQLNEHVAFRKRVNTKRFKNARLVIENSEHDRPIIHSVSLTVKQERLKK